MTESNNTHQPKKFKILLIGDSCIDEYIYGVCERLNPEAPVPVLQITRQTIDFGMASNVKKNLESFGCDVTFLKGGQPSIKKRYIDERSKQHIVRVDEDKISPPFNHKKIKFSYDTFDAIVISDYNKGFLNYDNMQDIIQSFKGPIFIDTKKQDLAKFEGCFVKINEYEYKQRLSECSDLIVTLGSKGARYKDNMYPTREVDLVDVCGAGDTFLASLTFKYLDSKDIEHAIRFANQCAAISVEHRGIYSLTAADLESIII